MTTPSTGPGVSRWTTTRLELIEALLAAEAAGITAPEMADAILSRLTPAEAPELAGPDLDRLRQMLDEPAQVPAMADEIARLRHLLAGYAGAAEEAEAGPVPLLPPPVADLGPVELELMGHRYRRGDLAEVVIAGTPFLRLTLRGGSTEFYRPDAVYCITPATAGVPEVQPALPAGDGLGYDVGEDEMGPF